LSLKIKFAVVAAIIAITGMSWVSQAATPSVPDSPEVAKLRAQLKIRFPDVTMKQIAPAPIAGWYELVTEGGLVYADANGDHLFIGKILDTKTRDDLTETRWNQLNGVEFDKLPFESAIKFVKGNGKRQVAIFEDPHCPYCRQIEATLKDINDVTIYVFLFPIESLHPGATDTSRNVWCSDDRATAWTKVMLEKTAPPVKRCDETGLQKVVKLGEQLGINGTPTLFFADGHRVVGSIPRDRLQKELEAVQAASKN
jgi:thiol:disulfide interchange protein DsbC